MTHISSPRLSHPEEELKTPYLSYDQNTHHQTLSGMSLTKPKYRSAQTVKEIKSKSGISLPHFLEVTHLNKVTRVVPTQWESQNLLQNVLEIVSSNDTQMLLHYSICMDRMSGAFLLNAITGNIVWKSSELNTGQPYFLAFSKKEQPIDKTSWEQLGEQGVLPLKGKELFWRESRSFVVKKVSHYEHGFVQDLHLHQSCGNPKGFRCPVMQCGNHFKKSCDLVIHFNVETGSNPYRCSICGQGFRRNILLKTHLSHKRCPILRHKRAAEEKKSSRHYTQDNHELQNHIRSPHSLLVPRTSTDPLVNNSTFHHSPMNCQRYEDQALNVSVADQGKLALQISQILKNYTSLMFLINKLSENRSVVQIREARLKVCLQIIATIRLLS